MYVCLPPEGKGGGKMVPRHNPAAGKSAGGRRIPKKTQSTHTQEDDLTRLSQGECHGVFNTLKASVVGRTTVEYVCVCVSLYMYVYSYLSLPELVKKRSIEWESGEDIVHGIVSRGGWSRAEQKWFRVLSPVLRYIHPKDLAID